MPDVKERVSILDKACFVVIRLYSVCSIKWRLYISGVGERQYNVSNCWISFINLVRSSAVALFCFAQNEITCPLRYAFKDSHTVNEDIPGVWLILRNNLISEFIKLTNSSSESSKGLNLHYIHWEYVMKQQQENDQISPWPCSRSPLLRGEVFYPKESNRYVKRSYALRKRKSIRVR